MYDKTLHLASTQRRLNVTIREYNTVHGFEPARGITDKLTEIRRKGGDLNGAKEPLERPNIVQPEYNCPVQNMKAAEAAAAELPHLQGEELRQQVRRVQELIATTKRMQRETEPDGSRVFALHDPPPGYDAAATSKQGCEASSTNRGKQKKHPRGHHERSVSSHP